MFAGCLSLFHLFLICANQTTHERMKKTWKSRGENPFNTGLSENCSESMCPLPSPTRFHLRERVESASITIANSVKRDYFSEKLLEKGNFCSKKAEEEENCSMNASDMLFWPYGGSTKGGSREAQIR